MAEYFFTFISSLFLYRRSLSEKIHRAGNNVHKHRNIKQFFKHYTHEFNASLIHINISRCTFQLRSSDFYQLSSGYSPEAQLHIHTHTPGTRKNTRLVCPDSAFFLKDRDMGVQ